MESKATPTIFIVDDEASILRAVARLLKSRGFQARTFGSARALLEEYDPAINSCLILDMAMPEMTGLDVQQALAERAARLPIIFLTGRGDVPAAIKAMRAGAIHFLTKPVDEDVLISAVREALEKDLLLRDAETQKRSIRQRFETLTPREREVMEHVVNGRLNKQIAAELGTVEKTIKVHRARVMDKMQAESVAALVRIALRLGISNSSKN